VKKRLDEILVERKLFESRAKAQASVIAGLVLVDDKKSEKPGVKFEETAQIRILGDACPYVGRGGLKIDKALDVFKVDVKDEVVADIGAGTGGFTDCLLQRGAKKVYAIDVGYGQLAWKLRQDARVKVMERKNARELVLEDLGEQVDLVVMDVSFISIVKVLPAISKILKNGGIVVTLVKPQFEAGRDQVPKGGVIKDINVHQKVMDDLRSGVRALGYEVLGDTRSPITGHDGNVEFFLYLRKAA